MKIKTSTVPTLISVAGAAVGPAGAGAVAPLLEAAGIASEVAAGTAAVVETAAVAGTVAAAGTAAAEVAVSAAAVEQRIP